MNVLKNQVRIIAGKWRGRKVSFLATAQLRPTGDKIRETAFNWLQNAIIDAKCLDLFTGSGIFGFEALSRGAAEVVMIDQDPKVREKIIENASILGADHYQIWLDSIPSEALALRLTKYQFDVVFIDPPFHQGLVAPTCDFLQQSGCLLRGGFIYIETEKTAELSVPAHWEIVRAKMSGNVAYYLCRVQ